MHKEPDPVLSQIERQFLINRYSKLLKTPITFIFVTRNRCPYKNFQKNPLVWSVQTLESNIGKKIDEYIFVNDCSEDYTNKSIDWCIKEYKLRAKVLTNRARKGCSWSRQIGLNESSSNVVYFGDDDCLFKPDFLLGSLITFKELEYTSDEKLAVLNLCVFDRALDFIDLVETKYIGKTEFSKILFYHNFDHKPKSHEKGNVLYKPIEVSIFKGVSVNNRDNILQAGGFLDLSMWCNDYSEHIELSKNLQDKDLLMYHLPDSRIAALHLKYGAKVSVAFNKSLAPVKFDGIDYSLGKMINWSIDEKVNTGARVSSEDFHIAEIGSFFSFYLKFGEAFGYKSAMKEYNNFVMKNKVFSTTPQRIDSIEERREIWIKAIRKGALATQRQTGCDYKGFAEDIIKKIKCWISV